MNTKYKKLLGAALLSICLCFYPISVFATQSGSLFLNPGMEYHIQLPSGTHVGGSVTSDETIDIFITNMSGINYWIANKTVPPYALWNYTANVLSFPSVYIPASGSIYYLVLGNNGSLSAFVQWEVGPTGIYGFEFIYAFFAVVAILGFLYMKKKAIL